MEIERLNENLSRDLERLDANIKEQLIFIDGLK